MLRAISWIGHKTLPERVARGVDWIMGVDPEAGKASDIERYSESRAYSERLKGTALKNRLARAERAGQEAVLRGDAHAQRVAAEDIVSAKNSVARLLPSLPTLLSVMFSHRSSK